MTETMEETGTELGQSDPGTETGQSTVSTESYIESDGTFKQGWVDKFVPEDQRGNTTWLGIKKVDDMANQIIHAQKKISQQGKGVFPITEKSTPLEVAEFRKSMGIPDKPEGYTFEPAPEVAQYYQDKTLMDEARKVLHQENLTPRQFNTVMALDAMRVKQYEEAMAADPVSFYEVALERALPAMKANAEKDLKVKWGDAYDARLNLANAAITENTSEGEDRDKLLQRIGNDPVVADFIATIQKKHHTEPSGVDTSLGTSGVSDNVDQRIAEIMRDPDYTDGRANPSRHKYLINETVRLREMKLK